jgi:hypothetical protein
MDMSHCIRRIGTFSVLVALGTVSGSALAQESSESPDSRPTSRNAGDDNRKRSDSKTPNERGSSNDRRASDRRTPAIVPTRMNEAFTFPLAGGCEYSSTVRGTVRAARGQAGDEPKYVPSLVVNAWISCQNNTEMRVVDTSLREGAMTRGELEQAIELRASLLADNGTQRCAYVPDFALGENKLSGVGVFYLCPAGGAQAGGAVDDLPDETRPAIVPEKAPEGRNPPTGRPAVDNRPQPETRGAVDHRMIREKSPADDSR